MSDYKTHLIKDVYVRRDGKRKRYNAGTPCILRDWGGRGGSVETVEVEIEGQLFSVRADAVSAHGDEG